MVAGVLDCPVSATLLLLSVGDLVDQTLGRVRLLIVAAEELVLESVGLQV